MELNSLLYESQLDPKAAIVLRHRPFEPELAKKLPIWAEERPDLFNAYQQCHGEKVEKAMAGASHVISFVAHGAGKAIFIGIYEIKGSKMITFDQFWKMPAHREMQNYGMKGFTFEERRPSIRLFDLAPTQLYSNWKGKLVIDWPGGERSWWRWAARNTFPINAIAEESLLVPRPMEWFELILDWKELSDLPSRWEHTFSQWRGVYYIFDKSDGKAYVGSACGKDNILGRWRNYAANGHGGNVLLRRRDPRNFQFSVLQLVSQDMEREQVNALECTWKKRLHTQAPQGLNEN
jgi:hypothetical protein